MKNTRTFLHRNLVSEKFSQGNYWSGAQRYSHGWSSDGREIPATWGQPKDRQLDSKDYLWMVGSCKILVRLFTCQSILPEFFFFYNKPVLLLKQERSKTVLFLKIKSFKTSETNRRPMCGSRRPQCDGSAYCPDCSASTTHDESLKKRVCRAPMTRRKPRPRPSPREVTSEPAVTLRWH